MTSFCITHKNCLDGLVSAWIFKKYCTSDKKTMFFTTPRNEWENIGLPYIIDHKHEIENVYFIDANPSVSAIHEFGINKIKIKVLDHHQDEFNRLISTKKSGEISIIFNQDECGATLAWQHFNPTLLIPKAIQYIRKNDICVYEKEEDKYVCEYIKTNLPTNSGIDKVDVFLDNFDEQKALEEGRVLYLKVKAEVEASIRNTIMVDFDGINVVLANESVNPSLVGHELAKRSPSGLGMAYYVSTIKSKVKAYVRGNGACGFCKKYGGGGHEVAAGFEMDILEFAKYLKTAKRLEVGKN